VNELIGSFPFLDVDNLFTEINDLLLTNIKKKADRVGWHQFIGEDKVGDVATAQGLLIHHYTGQPTNEACKRTLIDAQIQDPTENTGCWAFISNSDTPLVSATSWITLAIIASGEPISSDVIEKAINWIKLNQNDDGGWGPRKGLSSRIYDTYLAARVLKTIDPYHSNENIHIRNACRWISEAQNQDGGWGEIQGSVSTSIHTAFALLAISESKSPNNEFILKKGKKYLYSQWNPKDAWEHTSCTEVYEIFKDENASSLNRISMEYYPTPWVISALLHCGESIINKKLLKSLKWLLSVAKAGNFKSSSSKPNGHFWAIHDTIFALQIFKNRTVNYGFERMIYINKFIFFSTGKTRLMSLLIIASPIFLVGSLFGLLLNGDQGVHIFNLMISANKKYVGWGIWALIILLISLSAKLKIITWKDAIIGVVVPSILAITYDILIDS
jgi:hypothetical protein